VPNLFSSYFKKKGLLIKLFPIVLFVFTHNASAYLQNEDDKPTIYFEYLPFVEAYKTQQAGNAVSASNLLFLQNTKNEAVIKFLPSIRLQTELNADTEKPICVLFKLKTSERSDKYYFSLPISFLPTTRIYLRPGMPPLPLELLNEKSELKYIAPLFNDKQNTILFWGDISYGELVDNALKKLPSENKVVIKGVSSNGLLINMIERGRADYAIMFPSEVAEFGSKELVFDLLSYKINGIEPISTGHLMCNKNEASKAWLSKFNDILVEMYQSAEFTKANTFNITPQEEILVINAINQVKSNTLKIKPIDYRATADKQH
jgi:hypothetical protein